MIEPDRGAVAPSPSTIDPGRAWHLGHHFVAELLGCDVTTLNDVQAIQRILRRAVDLADLTIVDEVFHQFSPQGVTGVVVVEESHVSIHTWPELGYAAVDLFTCGSQAEGARAVESILAELRPERSSLVVLRRPGAALPDGRVFVEQSE